MKIDASTLEAPFKGGEATVLPAYIDYNGHMNVGYYHVVFDIAAEPFFQWLGFTDAYRKANDASTFALESHLHFVREVKEGDRLRFESRLIGVDHKRIHFYSEMYHADEGYLAATSESISAHVDMRLRRTAPMPEALQARLREIAAAHARLERPWQVGHVISVRPAAG